MIKLAKLIQPPLKNKRISSDASYLTSKGICIYHLIKHSFTVLIVGRRAGTHKTSYGDATRLYIMAMFLHLLHSLSIAIY